MEGCGEWQVNNRIGWLRDSIACDKPFDYDVKHWFMQPDRSGRRRLLSSYNLPHFTLGKSKESRMILARISVPIIASLEAPFLLGWIWRRQFSQWQIKLDLQGISAEMMMMSSQPLFSSSFCVASQRINKCSRDATGSLRWSPINDIDDRKWPKNFSTWTSMAVYGPKGAEKAERWFSRNGNFLFVSLNWIIWVRNWVFPEVLPTGQSRLIIAIQAFDRAFSFGWSWLLERQYVIVVRLMDDETFSQNRFPGIFIL